jgi:transposase-like protein
MSDFRLLIDGKPVEGAGTLDVINPATQGILAAAPRAYRAQSEETATLLTRINPDAASSLRARLEETVMVTKLGLPGALRRSLATTNPIESALSETWRVTARVTRWRDGDMRRRWCVSGLLQAESKFRRLKGHSGMPSLLNALERGVRGEPTGGEHEVA